MDTTSNVKIEYGVPIVSIHRRARQKMALTRWPFQQLQPEAAFFAEGKTIRQMSPDISTAQKVLGVSFTSRTVTRLKDKQGRLLPYDPEVDLKTLPKGVSKVDGVMIWRDRNTKRRANG